MRVNTNIDTLVFIGPHGSGKTTLGRRVASTMGWMFQDEIGKQLRWEALAANPDAHALHHQPAFDREVFARELARDQLRQYPRVVETWHPGNLAYTSARSPELERVLLFDVWWGLRALARHRIWVQPLRIDAETMHLRRDEPGPETDAFVDEMVDIGRKAEVFAQKLLLQTLPPINTAMYSERQSLVQIYQNLAREKLI